MREELPFRVALLTMLIVTMSITGYFRWKAAASGERVSHREEGYLFATVLRLAGLSLWIATFAYLLYPRAVQWASLPLPHAIRWIGVCLGVTAPLLMYWTLSSLGRNLTDTVVTRREATLVTTGPYRWVRHPFYVSAAVLMLSATIISAQAMIGISSIVILLMLAIRTPAEEQKLIERFGDSYRQYMQTTGRYLPRRLR